MSFHTTLLLIVAAVSIPILRSWGRRKQILEEYAKNKKEKADRLEKAVGEIGSICAAVEQVELNRMSILQLKVDVDRLENKLSDHKKADTEDKLNLIEGLKKITINMD